MAKIDLYPFQKKDVITIDDLDGVVLNASEMGTGKTIVTLKALENNPAWCPALIICPASLKYNWEHEAQKFGFHPYICETQTPPVFNRHDFNDVPRLLIINYDIFIYWAEYLKKLGIQTIVADEAHYLQNPTTQRTKSIKKFAKGVKQKMFLSGTPLTNRPSELYPVLSMLWPSEFKSFHEFAQRYCRPKWRPWGWDYKGSSNLDELHGRLNNLGMIRRKLVDVMEDFPALVRRVVPIELEDYKEYKQASEDFAGWITETRPEKAFSALRNEALTKVGYLLRLCVQLKMRGVVEWVNRYLEETEGKIVLFAHHEKAIDVLMRRVDGKKVLIDGSVSSRLRQAAVQQFQTDKKTRVFVGSAAAREGLTLTAANTVAFVEFWWRPGDHAQAEKRIHRIGQVLTSFIYYFVVPHTLEEKLCSLLQEKQGNISAVLDGGKTPDDINLLELLLEELAVKPGVANP